MSKGVVLCDVDLVVVESGMAWLAWLNYKSGKNLSILDCDCDYDLGKYFPELTNPYKFWCQNDLYDDLRPIEGAVETLTKLDNLGYDIIFASYCKKGHFGSKYDFLKRYLPFMKGFHATKEKHQVKADYFIDDRNTFLNKRDDGCTLIKYNTLYSQEEPLEVDTLVALDWDHLYNCITGEDLV